MQEEPKASCLRRSSRIKRPSSRLSDPGEISRPKEATKRTASSARVEKVEKASAKRTRTSQTETPRPTTKKEYLEVKVHVEKLALNYVAPLSPPPRPRRTSSIKTASEEKVEKVGKNPNFWSKKSLSRSKAETWLFSCVYVYKQF